jgi:hypothetical protein
VRIRADQSIGIINASFFKNALRQIFKINLMDNADSGRHDAKTVKRLCTPFKKTVTLFVAFKFHLHIPLISVFRTGIINLNRMVNYQINRNKRFNHADISAQTLNGGAHRGKVNQKRNTGEILKQNAGDDKRNFFVAVAVRTPIGKRFDIILVDFLIVKVA